MEDTAEIATDGVPVFRHSATSRYVGAAWRSRFLRAPKIALEIGTRCDFVEVGNLALVKLGVKTGADEFFFLKRRMQGSECKSLVPRGKVLSVTGKGNWVGE